MGIRRSALSADEIGASVAAGEALADDLGSEAEMGAASDAVDVGSVVGEGFGGCGGESL